MNAELTIISNKIQERIAAKSRPDADPMKVLASDVAEILQNFVDYLDSGTVPSTEPAPDAPTNPVTDNTGNEFTFTLATTNAAAPAPSGGTPSDNNDSFTYTLAQL